MLIHGLTSTKTFTPLLVDASGRALVTAEENTPLNPVGALFDLLNLALPAGTSTQTMYTVPAGQRMRLTTLMLYYAGTVAGVSLSCLVNGGGLSVNLAYVAPPVTGVPNVFARDVLLEAGWTITCIVTGATLNDDFAGRGTLQRYL